MGIVRSRWNLATGSQNPDATGGTEDWNTQTSTHTNYTNAALAANTYSAALTNRIAVPVYGLQGSITTGFQQATTASTGTFYYECTDSDPGNANAVWSFFLELSQTLTTTAVTETESHPVSFSGVRAVRLTKVKFTAAPSANAITELNSKVSVTMPT